MKPQNLLFTAAAVLLAACGGSGKGDNAAADNHKPSDFPPRRALYAAPTPPDAAEQAKIDAGKEYISRYVILDNAPLSQAFYVQGERVFAHMLTGDGAFAHVNARSLPQGFADRSNSADVNGSRTRQNVRSYQGFRGGVMLLSDDLGGARFSAPFGYQTPIAQIPDAGKASYHGEAFDRHERGQVDYHVDFAARSGHGTITGLTRHGDITLHPAAYGEHPDAPNRTTRYYNLGHASNAHGTQWQYSTRLFGDRAEEIAGELHNTASSIAFHGTRGEIME